MRFHRPKLGLLSLLLLVLPAAAQRRTESIRGREVAAGQVLVKFKHSEQATITQAQWNEDVDTAQTVNREGLIRMHSRSKDTASMLRDLALRNDVLYAEPDYIVHTTTAPNDPNYAQLWGLKNSGQTILGVVGTNQADIGVESAWAVTTGSQNIVVGVVDTGTDYTHPDLAANMWNNPTGIGGCAVGTHGYNAIAKTCDPMDDNFHGTHVSGTIGAVGNNNLGVVGVNWNVSIMALKFLDSTGSGSVSDAITVIEFAIHAKIAGVNVRVLSNSWAGSGFSQALSDEINKANTYDILFVAAAGNSSADNTITATYPANYALPNVIAVAATDNNDGLASFSNYGSTNVHLGAPGVSILSTQPGNRYQYLSGTSMATPHVSGAAALLLSKTTLTTAQLKDVILKNVDPIPSLTGKTITGGRLNVCRAMPGCVLPPTPDFSLGASPTTITVPDAGSTAVYTVTITRISNFTPSVALSITGLPSGVTAVFSPASTTGTTSTLTLTAAALATAGTYPLTITGTTTSPALTHTTAISLVKSAAVSNITWTKVAVEGDTVFLPKGTIYRFGVGTQYLSSATTTADWTVVVSPGNFGGDPAYGIVKELDVQGTGAGVIVNGVPFGTVVVVPPVVVPPVIGTWTKVAVEGDTVFLPKGTTYRFGVGTQFLATATTSADWTVVVSPGTLGGDPAYGIVKELDVQGTGAGVIVNGVPFGNVVVPPVVVPPVTPVTWTKVAIEGDTVFLPKGTTYRFGIGSKYLASVTTTADWVVLVYYTNFGGDPAPGVVKELDVQGDGTGVIVNGTPFGGGVAPPPVTWTKITTEGNTVFLPKGTTYRFGIGTQYLVSATTTADWTVLVYYTNFGGDPAPGVVKELDVTGATTGILVNGAPFAP